MARVVAGVGHRGVCGAIRDMSMRGGGGGRISVGFSRRKRGKGISLVDATMRVLIT